MWKKDEAATPPLSAVPEAPKDSPLRPEPAARPGRAAGERATIGRSISIRGDVTGDEDLMVQGRVEGSVNLQQHSVTIGPEGEVKASVVGRIVTVEGVVEGDIRGDEQVILRSSARVEGDITAPRVVLEDGARFRGGIDMGDAASRRNNGVTTPESKRSGDRQQPASASVGSASGSERVRNAEAAEVAG